MENKQYFLLENNIQKGPFTYDEVRNYGIGADTKVWFAGMEQWLPAASVPELQHLIVLLPPSEQKSRKWLIPVIAVAVLAVAGLGFGKYLFGSKPQPSPELPVLNNQQLYTKFAPGVVLIQHKFIYEINTGSRRFYFNEFYGNGSPGYISGLTTDSIGAVDAAENIQGTGFFVTANGKLLTNRHVAGASLTAEEQEQIAVALVHQLNSEADYLGQVDSMQKSLEQNDSLLAVLLQDSLTNAVAIADTRKTMAETQEVLEFSEEEGEQSIEISQAAVDSIASAEISVKRITLDLRIYMPGTRDVRPGNGLRCTILATSDEPEVDLALLQTNTQTIPDTSIALPDLSRIGKSDESVFAPQMSERLVLIGYNQGTLLSKTSEGIKAQLTEGKISQNTDGFKLMYTIPTLPGSSGSPVLDEKGRLVSVNFAGVTQTQSFNYGIQPGRIKTFLEAHNSLVVSN